jgi:hypothetical protein
VPGETDAAVCTAQLLFKELDMAANLRRLLLALVLLTLCTFGLAQGAFAGTNGQHLQIRTQVTGEPDRIMHLVVMGTNQANNSVRWESWPQSWTAGTGSWWWKGQGWVITEDALHGYTQTWGMVIPTNIGVVNNTVTLTINPESRTCTADRGASCWFISQK